MILSASRRTDIPALYPDWLLTRLAAGEVLVPNPYNSKRVTRLLFSPQTVDCIVFWTKNAAPLLPRLPQLDALGYGNYYFLFTLTPYDGKIECALPPKAEIEQDFLRLGAQIGASRLVWRYDPIFVDDFHTVEWHLTQFRRLCETLHPATSSCIISFLQPYRHIQKTFRAVTAAEAQAIAASLAAIAAPFGIRLFTCAQEADFSAYGIEHAACIDKARIEAITGYPLDIKADSNQRPSCGCVQSVDMGVYDSCVNGCRYCYAVTRKAQAARLYAAHDPNAPMLAGYPAADAIITEKSPPSHRIMQERLF